MGAVDLDVLVCVCRHPYTTVSVLAGLLGRSDRVVDYALHKLLDADLVGRKSYESIHLARSYVYYAQVEGLNTAARSRKESVQDMVRSAWRIIPADEVDCTETRLCDAPVPVCSHHIEGL